MHKAFGTNVPVSPAKSGRICRVRAGFQASQGADFKKYTSITIFYNRTPRGLSLAWHGAEFPFRVSQDAMTEIASPSSLLSSADLFPPGQRETKPRGGSEPSQNFGSLVSEAAQNRMRLAPVPDEQPAPRDLPKADDNRPPERQEARDNDAQPPREKPRKADEAEHGPGKNAGRAEGRKEKAAPAGSPQDTEDAATDGKAEAATASKVECKDANCCENEGEALTQKEGEIAAQVAESASVDPTLPVVAAPVADPIATLTPELPADPVVVPTGTALPVEGEASAVVEGDGLAIDPALQGKGTLVETPANVLIGARTGDKAAEGKPTDAPVSMEPEVAQPVAKGSADLVALLQARNSEAVAKPVIREQAAPEMPKSNFGDWINEFAIAQGAMHRSGDLVGSLDRALSGLPTPHAGQDALRPTPLQMLPIEIGMQAVRGVKTFQIRLDPAELGRVDVKLEIREDGEVKANLVVDRVETLAMLKRDASTLQQAFEQAGLRQSPDGLSFQLRGEQQGREGQRDGEAKGRPDWANDSEETGAPRPAEFVMRRVMIPNSSLDLVI